MHLHVTVRVQWLDTRTVMTAWTRTKRQLGMSTTRIIATQVPHMMIACRHRHLQASKTLTQSWLLVKKVIPFIL